jgi:O-antigen/teichoic acid export membrane protein
MLKVLAKDMAKYLPVRIVPVVLALFTLPIITRLFSPEDYGSYALVMAVVPILSVVAIGWLTSSIIRFFPAYKLNSRIGEFYSTVVALTIISVMVVSLLFLGILLFIRGHVTANTSSLMFIGALVFIVSACFTVLQTFLRATRQVGWYTSFSVWSTVMAVAIGLTLVIVFDYGVEGLIWGSILSIALVIPFLWKVALSKSRLRINISGSLSSELARYGFPLVASGLAAWIILLSDRYIISLFRGNPEVGIYAASYGVAQQSILLVTTLFMLGAGPIMMGIWEEQGEEASQKFVSDVTRYYLLIGLPAAIGLSLLAMPAVDLLVDIRYFAGYRVIPMVAFGILLLGLQHRFQAGFAFYKKTHLTLYCMVAAGLLNIGLNFLFVPKYGYMAAAATTLASYAFLLASIIWLSRRYFVWEFPFRSLVKAACASAVMGAPVYFIGNNLTSVVWVNLILGIFVGALIYFLMLLLLREFQQHEIQTALDVVRRVLRRSA